MLLLCLLNYTNITQEVLLKVIADFLPLKTQPFITSMLNEIYNSSSFTLLSLTAISALWVSAKGFTSIIQGLNVVYNTNGETRNYFILRIQGIFYTIIFIVMINISLIILVFGNRIIDFVALKLPYLEVLKNSVLKFRFLIFIGILIIYILMLYIFVPNRKTRILYELPGAIFSAVGWTIFSFVFSIYVDMSAGFSVTYGSLTTLVFIMLWLYACMNMLFVGAEINSFLRKNYFHCKNNTKSKRISVM